MHDDGNEEMDEEHAENRSVASIVENRKQRNIQEELKQISDPNEEQQSDDDLSQKIRETEQEIQEIDDELAMLNDDEDEEKNTYEENDDLIARIEEQIRECEEQVDEVQDYVNNMDVDSNADNNESDNESNDSNHDMDDDNENEVETKKDDENLKKATRSGRAYKQNGVKMRPTERNNHDRPRHNQPYLVKKKPKSNSLKNRSAMRKKAKVKKLKGYLDNILTIKQKARQKKGPIESKYNLAFQQIGSDRKVNYGADKAVLMG